MRDAPKVKQMMNSTLDALTSTSASASASTSTVCIDAIGHREYVCQLTAIYMSIYIYIVCAYIPMGTNTEHSLLILLNSISVHF
jgi:D-arabinose 5-phosphate isomerase GutQ